MHAIFGAGCCEYGESKSAVHDALSNLRRCPIPDLVFTGWFGVGAGGLPGDDAVGNQPVAVSEATPGAIIAGPRPARRALPGPGSPGAQLVSGGRMPATKTSTNTVALLR